MKLLKSTLKRTIYEYWENKLGDEFIYKDYFLQLKNDRFNPIGPVAGWQQGNIITLNLNTIKKMKVDPYVVLAHEYGHLINRPVGQGIMIESGDAHKGRRLSDYA